MRGQIPFLCMDFASRVIWWKFYHKWFCYFQIYKCDLYFTFFVAFLGMFISKHIRKQYFHLLVWDAPKAFRYLKEVLELSVKFLIEGRNCGFDPSLRELLIRSSLRYHVSEPILKVGWSFLGPPLSTSKTEKDLGSNLGICMGHAVLNPNSAYARLAWPTHPSWTR